jgi:N-acetylmuramate 1-kinase
MAERRLPAAAFLDRTGWARAQRAPLAGDASNRRYERLRLPGTRQSAVLMDAPPQMGEDARPFIAIARHLRGLGLSAPKIYAEDTDQGFLLLEDLGDALFARCLEKQPDQEPLLYANAIDVLIALHRAPLPAVHTYGAPMMADLAELAFTRYAQTVTGRADLATRTRFNAQFREILAQIPNPGPVLVLRDYHAENLIWLPDRAGVARVGLLDFQDAMAGHPAYDLVSLLQDVRRDVSEETERNMIARYIDATGQDAATFRAAYAVQGAQRNLRILGVFARLATEYGKPQYVDLIPRVWACLMRDLQHPALAPIAGMLRKSLPEPTPANLRRLTP